MERVPLPEYQGYNVPDIARCLAENGIKWNRIAVFKDENGKEFVEPARINYDMHKVKIGESKDFDFIHVSPFDLRMKYKGEIVDLAKEWVEYLAKNKSKYIEYNKNYLMQEEEKWEKYKGILSVTDEMSMLVKRNLEQIRHNKEKISLAEMVMKMEV